MEFRQVKAIEKERKQRWINNFGNIPNGSGIYILTREESGVNYSYVGQAKHILTRLADHLKGYPQIIDKSLYKRKLYSEDNKEGWKLKKYVLCDVVDLDKLETYYIDMYLKLGYQSYNRTKGSQSIGKTGLFENSEKGYREGLRNGYKKAQKEIAKLFEKNLIVDVNGKTNKNKEKALQKFKEFLQID